MSASEFKGENGGVGISIVTASTNGASTAMSRFAGSCNSSVSGDESNQVFGGGCRNLLLCLGFYMDLNLRLLMCLWLLVGPLHLLLSLSGFYEVVYHLQW